MNLIVHIKGSKDFPKFQEWFSKSFFSITEISNRCTLEWERHLDNKANSED